MKEILAEIPAQGHGEAVEVARNFANEKAFQVAVHTLRGNLSPAEAGEAFSNIAEASIAAVLSVIEEEFASWRAPHGETGIAVALLGDSATGQAALGAALDALCVYEGSARYYEELTHRFFEALREYSRENLLFTPIPESGRERPALLLSALAERFRTPGNAEGLLDLARARLVYASGDGAVRTKFEEALLDALSGGTAREALIASLAGTAWGEREPGLHAIAEMRGGLRDIERAARLLQLILAGQSTDTPAIGEAGLFEAAAGHGLISAEAAAGLVEAATLWRNLAGALQLVSEGDFDAGSAAPEARAVIARSCGLQDFDGLDATIRDTASRASAGVEAVKRLCSGRSAPSSSPETPDC